MLRAGPLCLDRLSRSLTVNEQEVSLRRAECAVLEARVPEARRLTGNLAMQAEISHAVTGFKSFLLKPLDPFMKKRKAGTLTSSTSATSS